MFDMNLPIRRLRNLSLLVALLLMIPLIAMQWTDQGRSISDISK